MSREAVPPMRDATVAALWRQGREQLARAGIEAPLREAGLLLAGLLGVAETRLWSLEEVEVAPEVAEDFNSQIARRLRGEPYAYLVGAKEFFGRSFVVDSRVLIPRPETEHLIECVLSLPLGRRSRVVDVGTGSGAIAITLALERTHWEVWATDCSLAALAVARGNALRYGFGERLRLVATSWLAGLELCRFDLLIANPPYIDPSEFPNLPATVGVFEPREALVSLPDGFSASLELLRATEDLPAGAWVVLEVGGDRATELAKRARNLSWLEFTGCQRDLAGRERVAIWRRRG